MNIKYVYHMLGVNGRYRTGLLLPIIVIFIAVVLAITVTQDSRGANNIDKELWSEDVQITETVDDTYPYLAMLNVQETYGGAFQIINARLSSRAGGSFQLSNMYTDKLGQTATRVANTTTMVNMAYHHRTHVSEKSVHYFEATDTIRFIARDAQFPMYLWFVLYNEEFEVLDENRLHVTDLFDDAYGFGLSPVGDVYWDAAGNAHLAGVLRKSNDDGTKRYRVFYANVTWEPFSISASYVHLLPPMDINDVTPRIHTNEKGVVGITHLDYLDGRFYRAISWKNATGTWETMIFDDFVNPRYCWYMASNGIYIDSSGVINLAWADASLRLKYLRIDEDRRRGTPVTISTLPVSRNGGMIDVQFQTNWTGNLFLAFNVVPENSKSLYVSDIPSAIVVVPVQNDSTIFNHEEYVIVDSPTATEYVFHIDENDNFYLIWLDMRSGLTEIFLKYLVTPGLTFEFDLVEWADAQSIRPDETKHVDLLLKNVGTLEFDVSMYTQSNASLGWSVGLDIYRAYLDAYLSIPVTLTIYCPPDAAEGEVVEIWINATTIYTDYSARLRLLVFVIWERELEVECDPLHHAIDPGGTVTYYLILQNIGELLEDILVSLDPIGPRGWEFTTGSSMVRLSPNQVATIEITVTSPQDSWKDDVFSLLVGFKWGDGTTAHPGLALRTVVRPTFFVTMEVNRTDAIVEPGEQVGFNITVGNAGNMAGTAFIAVEVLTHPGGWLLLLTSETVVLGSREERSIELLATAPPDAIGGEILVVRLRAYCLIPFSEVEREIRIDVAVVHDLQWTPSQLTWKLPPAGIDSNPLEFFNRGNTFETVRFRMDGLPFSWDWWLKEDGVETETIRIGPEEEATALLWLSIPAWTKAGVYLLQLSLDIDAGITIGHVTLKVNVDHISELDAEALSTDGLVYPGGYYEGTFEVMNQGNAPEFVQLSIASEYLMSPIFVVGGLNTTSVWVQLEDSRTVTLRGRLSEEAPVGAGHTLVVIRSQQDPNVTATVKMSYVVVQPELAVVAVEIDPPHPRSNEVVTIRLILRNSGPIEIVDLRASIFGGGDERIASIAPDGETTAVFTWVSPEAGEIEIAGIVTYGPGNHSTDWSHQLTIEDAESGPSIPWMILVGMVCAILITIWIIVNHRDQSSDNLV